MIIKIKNKAVAKYVNEESIALWVVLGMAVVLAVFLAFYKPPKQIRTANIKPTPTTSPADASYQKARDLCGSQGLHDLEWNDSATGKVDNVYCDWK